MPGKVVVYGGKGGLGHVVVETFKAAGYWVLSVDIVEQPRADVNVLVSLSAGWVEQEGQVTEGVGAALSVSFTNNNLSVVFFILSVCLYELRVSRLAWQRINKVNIFIMYTQRCSMELPGDVWQMHFSKLEI